MLYLDCSDCVSDFDTNDVVHQLHLQMEYNDSRCCCHLLRIIN